MEKRKDHSPSFYTPWYAADEELDSWTAYLHRNLHHIQGEEIPFKDSDWKPHEEDAQLHGAVLDALYKSENLDASKIFVMVKDKTVELSGEVKSEVERIEAEDITRSLPNVWSLVNGLVVTDP